MSTKLSTKNPQKKTFKKIKCQCSSIEVTGPDSMRPLDLSRHDIIWQHLTIYRNDIPRVRT